MFQFGQLAAQALMVTCLAARFLWIVSCAIWVVRRCRCVFLRRLHCRMCCVDPGMVSLWRLLLYYYDTSPIEVDVRNSS